MITPQSEISNVILRQAENDQQLIGLWLHGRSKHTIRYYCSDAKRFLKYIQKPLHSITLMDLQQFSDSLDKKDLSIGSKRRVLSSLKSLFAFGHRLGYLPFDVSRPLRLPIEKDSLAERILSEHEIHKMLDAENHPRNSLILEFSYIIGVRVSELCGLKWKDIQPREDIGQVTIFGKGSKTRAVLIPNPLWKQLVEYRRNSSDEVPVFKSRKGGHLDPSQVWRIVRSAAKKAGIDKPVSPHYYRHAHISHSIDNHCPIHLTQATCGHKSVASLSRYLHARPSDSSSKYLKI